ncbi:MAG: AraC family transcriptional regulator [Paludibacteraceae bacterium]|nr:AraC family transcriptional regulator [Paludibacteraceae bacterium]MBR6078374.1 AraC family transcriptional regulator [Paludibacteraceae bacterium]
MDIDKDIQKYTVENVDRNGIVIIDNVKQLPYIGIDFISPHLVMGLCKSGICEANYDLRDVRFEKNDFSIVLPRHIVKSQFCSDDYRAVIILVSEKMYNEMRSTGGFDYLINNKESDFRMDEKDTELVLTFIELMKKIQQHAEFSKYEIARRQLRIFCEVVGALYTKHIKPKSKDEIRNEEIFSKFHHLMTMHYNKERNVTFYAKELSLSPKYLSHIIKETTGRGAPQWINEYVITNAKVLLNERRDLSIKEISETMGFAELPLFCRYFKRSTGMSPSEFRRR